MMRIFTLLLCVFTFSAVNSQEIFWGGPDDPNGSFDGGLNDWTVNAVSPNENALWTWEADGAADQGAYIGTRGPIESETVANGAMTFDSDFLDNDGTAGNFNNGLAASPQVGELISPVIDCTDQPNVSVFWSQYTRNFNSSYDLLVTNDGGASWDTYSLDDNDNIPTNAESATSDRQLINITATAGGQAAVQFKFVYSADYYFWIIDDVSLVATPEADWKISTMYYPFQAFAQPQHMINSDTVQFAAEVINLGSVDQPSRTITASILNDAGTEVYSFTEMSGDFAAGDTAFIIFDSEILGEDLNMGEGAYSIVYDIDDVDGEDWYIENNGLVETMEISTDLHATNNGLVTGATYNGGDFTAASVFRTGTLPDNMEYFASNVSTSGAANGGNGIQNASYEIYVFKVKNQLFEELDPVFAAMNYGTPDDEHENLEYVGYSFASVSQIANFEETITELFSEDDDEGIILEENSTYIIGVTWDFSNNPDGTVFSSYSDRIYYYQPVSMIYWPGEQWYTLNAVERDIAWGIGTTITTRSTIDVVEKELAEDAVAVYPNPARDFTTLDLNFEEPTDASIILRDIRGNFIASKSVDKVLSQKVEFDVTAYPAGSYSFEVKTTDGGVAVKNFIITK